MPAYVIAHDATLAAIAEARRASLAALRRVKGMGPAKLEKYGDEILELVRPPSLTRDRAWCLHARRTPWDLVSAHRTAVS